MCVLAETMSGPKYPSNWDLYYPPGATFKNDYGDCYVECYVWMNPTWMIQVRDVPGSVGATGPRLISESELKKMTRVEQFV